MSTSFHAGSSYRNYLLTVLLAILASNYLDRLALGLLLQDIKIELALSDTQLGLLTGIAFSLFYAVLGLPIARWADRGNRVTIISLTAAIWSAAVALCSAAGNFSQLLLIRIGVAIGEAGCSPPALSLISDYFSRTERPRAVARYMLGAPIALVIGTFAAGWLNELYGWRTTFLFLGLPGLVLAALARFTLREPRRTKFPLVQTASKTTGRPTERSLPLKEVLLTLWGNRAYRHLLIGLSVQSFFMYGLLQWQPAFFIRSHGLTTGELGAWLALVYGATGLFGTFLGGELASRYAGRNERLQLAAIAAIYAGLALLKGSVYLMPTHHSALAAVALASVVGALTNGPVFAITQTLVPSRMRAMSMALILFSSNLIGMGFGPLAVGALSDTLRPWLAEDSLRYALLALCPGYFWAAWHLWRGSRAAIPPEAPAPVEEGSSMLPPATIAQRREEAAR